MTWNSFVSSLRKRLNGKNDFSTRPRRLPFRPEMEPLEKRFLPSGNLSVGDVVVTEGNSGTTNAVFTITRSGGPTIAVLVNYSTADGTATTANNDYQATSGSVSISLGQNKLVTVLVNGDRHKEADETFYFNISCTSTLFTVTDGQGLATILNDDYAELSVNDVTITEGNAGTTNAVFTITRGGDTTISATADYATANGSATTANADYQSLTGTVSFAAGEISKSVTVLVNGDANVESDETFYLNLTSTDSNVTITDGQGLATIINDDCSLAVSDVSINEGNSGTANAVFTITRTGSSAQAVSASYWTTEGSAELGTDFQGVSGTVTIDSGATTAAISVMVYGDTAQEPNESFHLHIASLTTYVAVTDSDGLATIVNDDNGSAMGTVTLAVGNVTVTESNNGTAYAIFTLTRSGETRTAVTLDYWTSQGSAEAGADYQATSGSVTFLAGETNKPVTVQVYGDTAAESDESFYLNISSWGSKVILSNQDGLASIVNDDSTAAGTATLSVNDASVTEGNSGTTNAVFTITRGGETGTAVTVNYSTSNGTAQAGSDYQLTAGSVVFLAGETSKSVTVPVNGDSSVETDETFGLNITASGSKISVTDGHGLATIVNDDGSNGTVTLSIGDVSVAEGNSGATNAVFTITRGGNTTTAVTVNYSTQNGSATSGSDYQAVSNGSVTFAAGETSKTATVTVFGDKAIETDETFNVNISATGSNISITDGTGLATITNDDATVTLSVNSISVTEGNSGTTNAVFNITRGGDTTGTTGVNYWTGDGSAAAQGDNDYVATTGSVTFQAGETSKPVTVPVNGDTYPENDETFDLHINSSDANVVITNGIGHATITSDDGGTATLSIGDCEVTEGNSGTVQAVFTVTRSGYLNSTVTVHYSTEDGTATVSDSDYQSTSGDLTFLPNVTQASVTVLVTGDTKVELDEAFTVKLSSPSSNATLSNNKGTGIIINDDYHYNLFISDVQVTEGNIGATPAIFMVSLTTDNPAGLTSTISVHYATQDGTATTANSDYQPVSGNLSFGPGAMQQIVTVWVNGDTVQEDPFENFTVHLSNPSGGAVIVDGDGTGTIKDDDGANSTPSTFFIASNGATEGDSGATILYFTVTRTTTDLTSTASVHFGTANGTATTADNDYTENSGTLTFGSGIDHLDVPVTITGDLKVEDNETFSVNLSNPSDGSSIGSGLATGTIINDDGPAYFTISDFAYLEGNAGQTLFQFIVTRTGDLATAVSVHYQTTDNQATVADNDYQPIGDTLAAFGPGQTAVTVTVFVNGDTKPEFDEKFLVVLSSPSPGDVIVDNTGVGTIQNDDGGNTTTTFSIAGDSVKEGNVGSGGVLHFAVSRTGDLSTTASVGFATVDGTAKTADSDYMGASGSVDFGANQALATISIQIIGDTKVESDEQLSVNLIDQGTNEVIASADGVIQNDDGTTGQARFSIVNPDNPANEGDANTSHSIRFLVNRSGDLTGTVTVDVNTQDGSAEVANNDYVGVSIIGLTFAPNVTSIAVPVTVIGDNTVEADETLTGNLSNPSEGAVIDTPTALATILNDDAAGTAHISIDSPPAVKEGNSGTTPIVFHVTRTGATNVTATVAYATHDGADPVAANNATIADNDYNAAQGSLTFLPNETSKTITVTVNGDTNVEHDESFTVELTSGDSNTVVDQAIGTGTIKDDDGYIPSFTIDAVEGEEWSGTLSTFQIVSSYSASQFSVTINWGDGSSSSGNLTGLESPFNITGSHLWIDADTYTVTITITDPDNNTFTGTGKATVTDQELVPTTLSAQAYSLTVYNGQEAGGEGESPIVIGGIVDLDPDDTPEDLTATVSWGGDPHGDPEAASIGENFEIIVQSHTFSGFGAYLIHIHVEAPGGREADAYSTLIILDQFDVEVQYDGPTSADQWDDLENVLVATVTSTDPESFPLADPENYQATIRWGDGGVEVVALVEDPNDPGPSGTYEMINVEHLCNKPGQFAGRIEIRRQVQGFGEILVGTADFSFDVAEMPPVDSPIELSDLFPADYQVGALVDGVVAHFYDSNPAHVYCDCDDDITIDWGDGYQSEGKIGEIDPSTHWAEITGQHTYTEPGFYVFSVSVTDRVGHNRTKNTTHIVEHAGAHFWANGLDVTVDDGVTLNDNLGTLTSGYSDEYAGEHFGESTLIIQWGDGGSGAGQFVGSASERWVISGTEYGNEGNFVPFYFLVDTFGSYEFTTGWISVTPADVPTPYLTFRDRNPYGDTDYTATAWLDDGDPVTATVDEFAVTGDLSAGPGAHTVSAQVVDDEATTSGSIGFDIAPTPLEADDGDNLSATEGIEFTDEIISYTADDDTGHPFGAWIDWGDGEISWGDASDSGVEGEHTYKIDGSYTINVLVFVDGGNQQIFQRDIEVENADIELHALDFGAFAGVDTGLFPIASFNDENPFADPKNFSATVDWGDGGEPTPVTVEEKDGALTIMAEHEYGAADDYEFEVTLYDDGGTEYHDTGTAHVAGTADTFQRSNAAMNATLSPVGEISVALNTGGLRLAHGLDFDLSPGTSVGGSPALVYNSDTVAPRPIIKAELDFGPQDQADFVFATLTWDGEEQDPVIISGGNFNPGDPIVVAAQLKNPVTKTGRYDWTLDLEVGVNGIIMYATFDGEANVLVRDDADRPDPVAAGWGISGVDRIVAACGGVFWATGSGDLAFFESPTYAAGPGDGLYATPADDFGDLMQLDDYSFLYVAKDRSVWIFNPDGTLASITDPHGLTRSYEYQDGKIVSITNIDGSETGFEYSGDWISAIDEPGDRTVVIEQNGNDDLAAITDSDETTRTFTYKEGPPDENDEPTATHLLASDQWQPYDAQFTYDDKSGLLTSIDRGLGVRYQIDSAAGKGLGFAVLRDDERWADVTDALGHGSSTKLNNSGFTLGLMDSLGNDQEFGRNGHGQVTSYTDALGNETVYQYNTLNDLEEVDYPDGGQVTYLYDPNVDKVSVETRKVSDTSIRVTVFAYNTAGDMTSKIEAYGTSYAATTTYHWVNNGLLDFVEYPNGTQQEFEYDANRRVTDETWFNNDEEETIADFHHTTYNDFGDVATIIDGKGNVTEFGENPRGLTPWEKIFDFGASVPTAQYTFSYLASGLPLTKRDGRNNLVKMTYDQVGRIDSQLTFRPDGTTVVSSTSTIYDVANNVEFLFNGDTSLTAYTYFDNNWVHTQTVKALQTGGTDSDNTYTYFDNGTVETVVDAGGQETDSTYDEMGRVVTQSVYDPDDPDSLVDATTNHYYLDGSLFYVTDFLGNSTYTFRDVLDRVIFNDVYDDQDQLVTYQKFDYDSVGNQIKVTQYDGDYTATSYDAKGRALTVTTYTANDSPVTSTTNHYDAAGFLDGTSDASGSTVYTNNALGQPRVEAIYDTDENLNEEYHYWYDAAGNLSEQDDLAGNTTFFTYDAEGRVVLQETYGTDGSYSFSGTKFDRAGNTSQSSSSTGSVQDAFDGEGRVKAELIKNADGSVFTQTTKEYEQDGTEIDTDGAGDKTITLSDPEGKLLEETVKDSNNNVAFYVKNIYNDAGFLIQSTDGVGNKTIYTRDAAGRALTQTVEDANNNLASYQAWDYNKDGELVAYQNGSNSFTYYTYDAAGNVTSEIVKNANNQTVTSSAKLYYPGSGLLWKSYDALNNYTVFTYNGAGRVLTERTYDAALATFVVDKAYDYDGAGRLVVMKNQGVNRTFYTYDGAGNKTSEKVYDWNFVPASQTFWTYDAAGNVATMTDGAGRVTVYTYKGVNLKATETVAYGTTQEATTTYQYDAAGRLWKVTDADGNIRETLYDGAGRVHEEKIYKGSNVASDKISDYDAAGRLVDVIVPGLSWTGYTYDAAGRVVTQTVRNGGSSSGTIVSEMTTLYDAAGNLIDTEDDSGRITMYTFDAAGHKRTQTAGYGTSQAATTVWTYDAAGRLAYLTDPNGNITSFWTDAAGRVYEQATIDATTTATVRDTQTTFNIAGWALKVIVPGVSKTNYVYDGAGRVLSQTTVNPTTNAAVATQSTLYNAAGDVTQTTDGSGHVTVFGYDFAGRKHTQTVGEGTGQAGTTTWNYTAAGVLQSITDPDNNTTTYVRDAAGNPTSITDPLNHVTTEQWDVAGRLHIVTDRNGRTRTLDYDGAGRQTSETWSGGGTADQFDYVYLADGTLQSATNSYGTYTFTYDSLARVHTVTEPTGVTLTMTYDANSNRTVVTDSLGGETDSEYDGANQLKRRIFKQANYIQGTVVQTWNLAGYETLEERFGGGSPAPLISSAVITPDAAGRVTWISYTGPLGYGVDGFIYQYDLGGQLLQAIDATGIKTYSYDGQGQLTNDNGTPHAYDPNGNQTGGSFTPGSNNQLASDGTWNYAYDAEGNVMTKTNSVDGTKWLYGYDNKNELVSAVKQDAGGNIELTAVYKYDAFGNRIEKQVDADGAGPNSAEVTKFALDGWKNTGDVVGNSKWDVLADLAVSGSLTTRYLRGDAIDQIFGQLHMPMGETDTEMLYWYLTDSQGSVRDVEDNTGMLRDSVSYDAFGNIIYETAPQWRGRYAWTGRELDVETGLQYNRARYYDAPTGRWISQDPLGFDAGDSNLYRYVHNRPDIGVDPSGLDEPAVDWAREAKNWEGYRHISAGAAANAKYAVVPFVVIDEKKKFEYALKVTRYAELLAKRSVAADIDAAVKFGFAAPTRQDDKALLPLTVGAFGEQREFYDLHASLFGDHYYHSLGRMVFNQKLADDMRYAAKTTAQKKFEAELPYLQAAQQSFIDKTSAGLPASEVERQARDRQEAAKIAHLLSSANLSPRERKELDQWYERTMENALRTIAGLIPIVGSAMSLVEAIEKGAWDSAILAGGFLVLDVTGVAGAAGKLAGGARLSGATDSVLRQSVVGEALLESRGVSTALRESQITRASQLVRELEATEGVTREALDIADAIRHGDIEVHILGRRGFTDAYRSLGGEGSVTRVRGFAYGDAIYLRRGSTNILSESVHEGTHALDFLQGLQGTSRQIEIRAYFAERRFQQATQRTLDFPNWRDVYSHIRANYNP